MKHIFAVAMLMAVAGRAAIVVTDFKGSPNAPGTATLSFDAAASARELWCAWDGADRGADFSAWASNGRMGVVAAQATTFTAELPEGAKGASAARFFLVPVDGTYALDHIRSTGAQCIDTGVKVAPAMAVSAEVELVDVKSVQQRIFGTADNALTVAGYISNGGVWAWAFQDDVGNWFWFNNMKMNALRTRMTLDGLRSCAYLSVAGVVVASNNMTVAHTKTSALPLALLGESTTSGAFQNFMTARFYGATISDSGVLVADYRPYVKNGVAGVRNAVDGAFLASATDVPFVVGEGRDAIPAGCETGASIDLSRLRRGDVWSDATYLWDFTRADLNGDGEVQAWEIRNALQFGSTNANGSAWGKTVYVKSSAVSAGTPEGITWKKGAVSMPSRGFALEDATYLDIPAVYKIENGTTNMWANGVEVQKANIAGSITVVARLKVDNFAYSGFHNSPSWFLNNWLHWGNWRGDQFGFNPSNIAGTNGYLRFLQGQNYVQMGGPAIHTNVWYDVAYSLRDNGDKTANWIMAYSERDMGAQGVYVESGTFRNAFTNEWPAGTQSLLIGGEYIGRWSQGGTDTAGGGKAFNGSIQRIAVWSRALSEDEIREAFVQTPPIFRVGTENSSADEFGLADETGDAFDAERQPWHEFRGTLSAARPSVTIAAQMRSDSRKVPYALRVRGAYGSATLEAFVDGASLGVRSFNPGDARTWFVPAKLLARKTGAISVELRWRAGGAFAFDVVEMTGSAAIGVENGNTTEMSQEGTTEAASYAGQWNFKRFARASVGGSASYATEVDFWVPPELAARNAFRYTTRILDQGSAAASTNTLLNVLGWTKGRWPFALVMNGKKVWETQGIASQTISCTFEKGELKAGWNKFRWVVPGPLSTSLWVCLDYHRLEVVENPSPSIVIFR